MSPFPPKQQEGCRGPIFWLERRLHGKALTAMGTLEAGVSGLREHLGACPTAGPGGPTGPRGVNNRRGKEAGSRK